MASITSTSSSVKGLRDLLDQLKVDAKEQADVQERIQQQLATVNDEDNLKPGDRRFN